MVERSGSLSQSFAAWELWLYQGWRDHVILSLPKWELHVTMVLLDSCAHVNTATNYMFATFFFFKFFVGFVVNTSVCLQQQLK